MTFTTFDEVAFELLPKTTEPLQRMRKQAFEEFRALPIPSQETEEWRYTDLSDFELSFEPHVPGGVRTTSGQDPRWARHRVHGSGRGGRVPCRPG